MNPTGSFDRFKDDILTKYNDYEYGDIVTFGILVADPRQSEAKEYIYNYLDVFHKKSGRNFDFFIPGYTEYSCSDSIQAIILNRKKYYFDEKMFFDFLDKIEEKFKIEYTYNPMLILMSMELGNVASSEYIVLELDDTDKHNIRRSGVLFREIFQLAHTTKSLQDIHSGFIKTYLKGNLLNNILEILQQDSLLEIIKIGENFKKYRIRG